MTKGQELRAVGIIQKTPYDGGYYQIQTFVVAIYNKDLVRHAREKMWMWMATRRSGDGAGDMDG